MNRRLAPLGAVAVATLFLTSACVDNAAPTADGSGSGGPTAITVDSSADACDVSTAEATTSPSSTCWPKTACGSSPRWRTSAPV
jgi:hypothetical protein